MHVLQGPCRQRGLAKASNSSRRLELAPPLMAPLARRDSEVRMLSPGSSQPWPAPSSSCAGKRQQDWRSQPGVVCQAGRGSSEPWWLKDNPPNMREIHSIQELVDQLADAGDRLVIVEYYAQWCNACRALFPKLCRILAEHTDVLFLKVDFDKNRDACRTLSVKVLPYFHFYRGAEGRVAAFSCTISKLQVFKDALENFSSPFCSLEPAPGLAEFPSVVAHPELAAERAAAAARRGATSGSEEELHPLADTPSVVG